MINFLNAAGEHWWSWQVAMLWQTAVLIGILWIVDVCIRKWAHPQVRYALWMLVLVKLLIPPTWTSPASVTSHIPGLAQKAVTSLSSPPAKGEYPKGGRGLNASSASVPDNTQHLRNTKVVEMQTSEQLRLNHPGLTATPPSKGGELLNGSPSSEGEVHQLVASKLVSEDGRGEGVAASMEGLHWQVYAMFTWLAGMIVLSTWLILRLSSLRREHINGWHGQAKLDRGLPERFYQQLQAVAAKLRLKRIPQVILTDKVACPAVFGVFRPVLLMPAKKFKHMSQQDTEHILLHELAHIKRGDLLVHAVYMLVQIVYWFNPLLWMARRPMQNLRELCCDATVARLLRDKTYRYRETLLETARQLLAEPVDPGLGLLGLFENSSWLVTRLRWLEKNTWKNRPLRIATIIALVAVMTTCVLPMAQGSTTDSTIIVKKYRLQHPVSMSQMHTLADEVKDILDPNPIAFWTKRLFGGKSGKNYEFRGMYNPGCFVLFADAQCHTKVQKYLKRHHSDILRSEKLYDADDVLNIDTFADTFRTIVHDTFAHQNFSFLTDADIEFIANDLKDFVRTYTRDDIPKEQLLEILEQLDEYIYSTFPSMTVFLQEHVYLAFDNRIKTLKLKLWHLIAVGPLSEQEQETLQEQKQWVYDQINNFSGETPLVTAIERYRIEKCFEDVFNGFSRKPMPADVFEKYKADINKESSLKMKIGIASCWSMEIAISYFHKNPKEYPYPFGTISGFSGSRDRVDFRFKSDKPNLYENILLRGISGKGPCGYDIATRQEIDAPNDCKTADQMQAWLNIQNKGDIYFDSQSQSIISGRDAKMTTLDVDNWIEADRILTEPLRQMIHANPVKQFCITGYENLYNDDLRRDKPKVVPLIAIETKEGLVAVIRPERLNEKNTKTLNVSIRTRPENWRQQWFSTFITGDINETIGNRHMSITTQNHVPSEAEGTNNYTATEKTIIDAIKTSLPDNYFIKEIQRNSWPVHFGKGNGVALYIADKNIQYRKQQYSSIVWLMPKDYTEKSAIKSQAYGAAEPPAVFMAETNNYNLYNWPGPTGLAKKIVEMVKKTESKQNAANSELTATNYKATLPNGGTDDLSDFIYNLPPIQKMKKTIDEMQEQKRYRDYRIYYPNRKPAGRNYRSVSFWATTMWPENASDYITYMITIRTNAHTRIWQLFVIDPKTNEISVVRDRKTGELIPLQEWLELEEKTELYSLDEIKRGYWENFQEANINRDKQSTNSDLSRAESRGLRTQNYKATLPNGVTVELVGLCSTPGSAKWWSPAGIEIPEPQYRAETHVGTLSEEYGCSILAKINAVKDAFVVFRLPSGYLGGSGRFRGGDFVLGGLTKFPLNPIQDSEKADIGVGVAQGAWINTGVELENKPDAGPVTIKLQDEDTVVVDPLTDGQGVNGHKDTTVLYGMPSSVDYEFRAEFTTKDGSVLPNWSRTPVHARKDKPEKFLLVMENIGPKEIVSFRLFYRKIEWTEFKNVSLRPGNKTEGKVLINDGQSQNDTLLLGCGGTGYFDRNATIQIGQIVIEVGRRIKAINMGSDIVEIKSDKSENKLLLGPNGTGYFDRDAVIQIGDAMIKLGRRIEVTNTGSDIIEIVNVKAQSSGSGPLSLEKKADEKTKVSSQGNEEIAEVLDGAGGRGFEPDEGEWDHSEGIKVKKLIQSELSNWAKQQGYNSEIWTSLYYWKKHNTLRGEFRALGKSGWVWNQPKQAPPEVFLNVDKLKDGIWYLQGIDKNPTRWASPLRLELLIPESGQIPSNQRTALLDEARKHFLAVRIPNPKWTRTLPNGVIVEFAGITEFPDPGRQWWAPDGKSLGYNPAFGLCQPDAQLLKAYHFVNQTGKKRYEAAFAISWPKSPNESKRLDIFTDNLQVLNRGGCLAENEVVTVPVRFANNQKTFDVTLKIATDGQNLEEVTFKNASLRPGGETEQSGTDNIANKRLIEAWRQKKPMGFGPVYELKLILDESGQSEFLDLQNAKTVQAPVEIDPTTGRKQLKEWAVQHKLPFEIRILKGDAKWAEKYKHSPTFGNITAGFELSSHDTQMGTSARFPVDQQTIKKHPLTADESGRYKVDVTRFDTMSPRDIMKSMFDSSWGTMRLGGGQHDLEAERNQSALFDSAILPAIIQFWDSHGQLGLLHIKSYDPQKHELHLRWKLVNINTEQNIALRPGEETEGEIVQESEEADIAEGGPDLIFEGAVEKIEISRLESRENFASLRDFVVVFRVDKVTKGDFKDKTFSFRIHSPSKSGLVEGGKYTVEATKTDTGYVVDDRQWIRPETGRQSSNPGRQSPDQKAEWVVKKDSGGGKTDRAQIAIEAKVFTTNISHTMVSDYLKDQLGVEPTLNSQGMLSFTALTDAQSIALQKWMTSTAGTSTLTSPKVRVFDGEKTQMGLTDTQKFTTGYDGDTPKVDEFTTGITFEFTPTFQKENDVIRLNLNFDKTMVVDVMKQTTDSGKETEMPGIGTKSVHTTIAIPQGKTMLVPVAGTGGMGGMAGMASPAPNAPKTEQIYLLIKTELETQSSVPSSQSLEKEATVNRQKAEEGRIISVPKWPRISLETGGFSGYGSFSIQPWTERTTQFLSGPWKDIQSVDGKIVIPDGYALKLGIYSGNNTDLASLDLFAPNDIQILSVPHSNQIDSRAMPHIGRLAGLQALLLGGTNIRDDDLKHLVNLKGLKALSLQDCALTDDAIEHLSKMKMLNNLNLWGTAISNKGYKKLRKQLSQCDVQWKEELRKDRSLIGVWNSIKFSGLCARDFKSEIFTFHPDGTFEEMTQFNDGISTELSGIFRIEKNKIIFDDGDGYKPEVPYKFKDGNLIISRRANIGRVDVIFEKVELDALPGIKQNKVSNIKILPDKHFQPYNKFPVGMSLQNAKEFLVKEGFKITEEPVDGNGWLSSSKYIGPEDTHHILRAKFKSGQLVNVLEGAIDP